MSIKAYLLINTDVGKGDAVVKTLDGLDGVIRVNRVTGPYDVIVTIDVPDLYSVGKFVNGAVHTVPGVTKTLTCINARRT